MAEASGGRTHRRRGDPPPAGFEDRDDHRTACASVLIIAEQHRLADFTQRSFTPPCSLSGAAECSSQTARRVSCGYSTQGFAVLRKVKRQTWAVIGLSSGRIATL